MIGHPSKRTLRAWLSGEIEDNESLDEHIGTCARCAAHLENIDEPRTDGAIAASLTQVLAPPTDLTARLEERVAAKLDSRQVVGYIADLFGAGMETSKLLLTDET